jgi:1-acyl-sn-glycerol-3-phosphate acyltransferase
MSYVIVAIGALFLALQCFAWSIVALILHPILPARVGRKIGRGGATWTFRIFLSTMQALGAWRLDLRELDALRDDGPLIVAPNHPCLLDAVLVVSRLPNALCVMKASLLDNFLLGPGARLARYLRNDSLLKLMRRAQEELRQGGHLLIFPEGTRTVGGPIGALTEAAGALSRRCGVPVQTVIIEADSRYLGKGTPLLARPRLPLSYRVRLGRRFEPPADVREFTLELERYFVRELAVRTAPVPAPAIATVEEAPRLRG